MNDTLLTYLSAAIGVLIVIFIIAVVLYVLNSYSTYRIAKNRGIKYSWLAWIPLARNWVVGSVGDYYFEKKKNKKYYLGWISLLALILSLFFSNKSGVLSYIGFALTILAYVIEYISLYQFYKSVNPKMAVAIIVLTIVIPITSPFFMFHHRDRLDTPVDTSGSDKLKNVEAINTTQDTAQDER